MSNGDAGVRVFVVDDHALVREAICARLDAARGISVVGEAGDGQQAVHGAHGLAIDVMLVDAQTPGLSGFEAVRRIRAARPGVGAVFLSDGICERLVQAALEVGARGFILKQDSSSTLIDAIHEVAAGRAAFSRHVRPRVELRGGSPPRARSRVACLTSRELEVLRLIAQGLSKKEIAALLDRSTRTVDAHVRHIMHKLEIHDRVGLARFAFREGVGEP